MYFIHVKTENSKRYELLGSGGHLVNRYMFAIFFDSLELAKERVAMLKEQNPTCDFKIIKK